MQPASGKQSSRHGRRRCAPRCASRTSLASVMRSSSGALLLQAGSKSQLATRHPAQSTLRWNGIETAPVRQHSQPSVPEVCTVVVCRMSVLRKLGHIDSVGLVQLKGKAACEVDRELTSLSTDSWLWPSTFGCLVVELCCGLAQAQLHRVNDCTSDAIVRGVASCLRQHSPLRVYL